MPLYFLLGDSTYSENLMQVIHTLEKGAFMGIVTKQ